MRCLDTKFQLMRFWLFLTTVSHICTFYLVAGGGGSHQVDGGGHGMSNLISAELMRFAKEDIGSCKEGRAT